MFVNVIISYIYLYLGLSLDTEVLLGPNVEMVFSGLLELMK